jgi:glutamine synthetase
MFKNIKEMIEFCKGSQIKTIDFKVVDLAGRWHRLTITSTKLSEDIMEKGIGFDGSSYGFLTVEKSDMVMIPDVTSAYEDIYRKNRTIVVLANIYEIKDGQLVRFEDDPRYVAEKAEDYMRECGIAEECLLGPEFEFFVLDHASYQTSNAHMEVRLDSEQANWNSGRSDKQNLALSVPAHGGYHLDSPYDSSYEFRNEVCLQAEKIGIPIKYHHSENGGPGQVEIEVNFDGIKKMGDSALKLKNLLNNCGMLFNKTVTFMPKPFVDECGSSMHVHMLLKKDGRNLMYDADGYSGLSGTAHHAIAGILKHIDAITAIANPSTNSYKRLVPGYEAPITVCFGRSNRSASIRIPGYAIAEDEKRFELRSPDATSNAYLAYSAIMMAAFDGIINKMDSSEFGPYDVNLYDLSEEEQSKVRSLPTSLIDAANALEKDQGFLLTGGVFTENMIANHLKKIRADYYKVNRMPHPIEFEMYFNA